jgi:hypothetical protein
MVGRVPIAGVMYTAQGFAKRELNKLDMSEYMKNFLSGSFAGFWFANAFFVFDLLKTRAQMSRDQTLSYRTEITRIFKTEGLRGFTRGWVGL